jgi:hypothetical protein
MDLTPENRAAAAAPATGTPSRTRKRRRWFFVVFSLPFIGVGGWVLLWALVPMLVDAQRMQDWQQGEARLTSAELVASRGSDSTTYRVRATYTYEYGGREYRGDRVAVSSAGDNIGDFQRGLGRELERAHREGRPVPVWINPENPREAVLNRDLRWGMVGLFLMFVLVFGGAGAGMLWYGLRTRAPAKVLAPGDKPWLLRPEWAGPGILSSARSAVYVSWFFAAFWNLIAIPVGAMTLREVLDGNRPAIFGLLFPLVGVGLIIWALKETASWRRFGQARLVMDPYPGAIGGQVGGTLAVRVPDDATVRFKVTLSCLYSYITRSGKNRRRRERLVWQREGYAHARPHGEGTELEILFDVDDELPASDFQDGSSYHLWRLLVEAPLPGVDFVRSFEIPVFATGEPARRLKRLSSGHRLAAEERVRAIEEVLEVRHIPGGVELHFPAFRHPGGKLAGIAVGLVFLGVAVLGGDIDMPALVRLLSGALGAAVALACVYHLLVSLHVRIDNAGLEVRRRLLGLPAGGTTIPRHDLRSLTLKQSYRSSSGKKHTVYFKLQALTGDGKAVKIGHNLVGRDVADEALAQLSALTGIPAAEPSAEQPRPGRRAAGPGPANPLAGE